jgi:hypothetical protein
MPSLIIQRTADASEDVRLQSLWYDINAGQDVAERYLNFFWRSSVLFASRIV